MVDVGDAAPDFELPRLDGGTWRLSDQDGWRHLQFHRYAGCPSCLLHVRQVAARHDEVRDLGITHVALFHSPVEDLERTAGDPLPFPVLADPDRRAFDAYGVGADWRGLGSWRTLKDSVLGLLRGHRWRPSMARRAGWTGLPADVLVAPDGTVAAVDHGTDFADTWTVDDLIRVAAEVGVEG